MPNFTGDPEPLVLLLLDTDRISAEIRWEDGGDDAVRLYPHVYGPVPTAAVTAVLPFLKDEHGNWRKNPELAEWPDQ